MEGETSKTYLFGNDSSNLIAMLAPLLSQRGIDPSVLAAMNNGGFGGNNFLWVIFLFFLMGWGGNGWGNFGGNAGNGTGFLASQMNNDAGRDLLLQAIQGNGSAISQLATTLNSDINAVTGAVNAVQNAVQNVGSQVGMSGLQTINAIQAGNASLSAQLAQCCCDNRLLTTQQGYEAQIRTLEQTNQLGAQSDRNTRSITDAIAAQTTQMTKEFCDVKERELQNKIDSLLSENSSLKSTLAEARQTAQFNEAFNTLNNKITELSARQPQTVPVIWPNLSAVNNTPFGGYTVNNGSIWG